MRLNEYSVTMGGPRLFESRPDDTRTEMLQATYAALQKHGYTDLTIDDIDEEFPKSKSLIYQYYSGKDDLLLDFLAFMLEHFESEVKGENDLDPEERLSNLLDWALSPTQEPDQRAFTGAISALRGQAAYNAEFRARFTDADRVFRTYIESILRDGIEDGSFDDVETAHVAEFVLTTIQGVMFCRSTTEEGVDVAAARRELDRYLSFRLGLDGE